MKKLKFLALGLAGLMAFASCGKDDENEVAFCSSDAVTNTPSVETMGGASSKLGSFWTFDNGVQTKDELGETGTNVVFCFSSLTEKISFISPTESQNTIVNKASETKFVEIKEASVAKASKLNESDFKDTKIEFSSKMENGKRAVAFLNDKCKGFIEITDYNEEKTEVSVKVYVIQK